MASFENNYFEGQVLIATPTLVGSCFEKSVIFICSHNDSGAMGILINHALSGVKCSDVFGSLNFPKSCTTRDIPVHFGGPVESSRGFVLHTNDYMGAHTYGVSGGVSLTSDAGIFEDMKLGKGPKKSILALGYAGWGAGQLEKEIMENTWINSSANKDVIFDTKNQDKWEKSAKMLGINMYQYSHSSGNA